MFRKHKLAYQLFNLFKRNQLKHNVPHYKKYGLKKKYYSSLSSLDFKGIESPLNLYDAKDSSLEMPSKPEFKSFDEATQEALLTWSKNGYAILPRFYSSSEVDAFNEEIENLVANKTVNFRYKNKLMFAVHHSKLLKNAAMNKKLIGILNFLMNKEVELFQSINFLKGSQQRTHSDSIHMTTFPYGNLIAVWIALEDITASCGPLHYYPGSHKLPYIFNPDYGNASTKYKLGNKLYVDYEDYVEKVVAQKNLEKKVFLAKKGDILIWHANLLHGGEAVTDPTSSRKSMVLHYYAGDAICFHEISERPTLKKV